MASLIQQIDGRSVHQIQSGQVINDGLNSAVKELVENALDAHATSIEVRFKNYGLESLEVIDNGDGISSENYENIALKHYTSKLRTYADLESVTTFGFRGEALSSLCALSDFYIVTAMASEAPKGTKLEFENSGKLKSKTVAAASKGTTVCVGNLFKSLPVRRRELERNIRRDYAKVLGLLQAYASVCVGVKFSVFNQPLKGKRTPVFATKGNPTTRENISNVFGSKTLAALVLLDLQFEMQSTAKPSLIQLKVAPENREVKIVGHISRPVVGEGRNAPDRQMFFVNGRPCILPQISKAFNEVYKGFNVTQSPFIFADLQLDTHAYDVNVSPDKRTILLHDQANLLENLKNTLTELFEKHEQTVPLTQLGSISKLPGYKQASLFSSPATGSSLQLKGRHGQWVKADNDPQSSPVPLSRPYTPQLDDNGDVDISVVQKPAQRSTEKPKYNLSGGLSKFNNAPLSFKPPSRISGDAVNSTKAGSHRSFASSTTADEILGSIEDNFLGQDDVPDGNLSLQDIPSTQLPANPRPPPLRPKRMIDSPATITIGDRTPVTTGTELEDSPRKKRRVEAERQKLFELKATGFISSLNKFMGPGSQISSSVAEIGRGLTKSTRRREVKGDVEQEPSGGARIDYDEEAEEYNIDVDSQKSPDEGGSPEHCCGEGHDTQKQADIPLFLPSEHLDQDSEVEGEIDAASDRHGEPNSPALSLALVNGEDDDQEYVPEAEAEAEQRATARAARLLKEAEEYEVSRPINQLLERNFRLFNDPRAISANGMVRFEKTSLDQIRKSAQRFRKASDLLAPKAMDGGSEDLMSSPDEAAEQRLTLTVTKEDFFNMKIHGQFNKGFILATRGNELFIIDQHASDEKYNFETLQATTVVQNQPLVVPRTLDLMAMDEIAVMDNLDVLKKNGFVVEIDPEMPTGRRCKLISLPMSRETVFGVEDLEELIHLIHQSQGSGTSHLRCSKVRSMFAMRACRKSVMVGKALPIKVMEKIVRHMGELDKPWNCPHGRPTMRHLAELGYVERWTERDETRGGGGLKWGGEAWREMLEMQCEERQAKE